MSSVPRMAPGHHQQGPSLQRPQNSARGSLTEVTISETGTIRPCHLLPMLAHGTAGDRWLMWMSPSRTIDKRSLESMNLRHLPVIHLDISKDTQLALCCRTLESGNSHVIVEWQGHLDAIQRDTLRGAAHRGGSQLIIVQHEQPLHG